MLIENFKPLVATEVIGCPDPLVTQAIVMAAIEFCQSSLAWVEWLDPIVLIDGAREYALAAPQDGLIHSVIGVYVGARRLNPVLAINTVSTDVASEPWGYNMANDRDLLTVYPTPASVTGASLLVRAVFIPTTTAATLPNFLGQRYLDAITSGAKARLMSMPGVSWSNPQLAVYYQSKVESDSTKSRISDAHDRVPGAVFIRPRVFGV